MTATIVDRDHVAAVQAGVGRRPGDPGPLVKPLGGADISWVVGWIVPAAAYLLLARAVRAPAAEGSAQA